MAPTTRQSPFRGSDYNSQLMHWEVRGRRQNTRDAAEDVGNSRGDAAATRRRRGGDAAATRQATRRAREAARRDAERAQVWFVLLPAVLFFVALPERLRVACLKAAARCAGCPPPDDADSDASSPMHDDAEAGKAKAHDAEAGKAKAKKEETKAEDEAKPAAAPRLAFVDQTRVTLTFLVVCHHCACAVWQTGYSGPNMVEMLKGTPQFAGASTIFSAEVLLDWFLTLQQIYFMATFFFISGVFTPRSFRRKGWRRFLEDKAKRLALPALVWYRPRRPRLAARGDAAAATRHRPLTHRGDAAAAARIFPRYQVAATPRPRRGYSVVSATPRLRRRHSVETPTPACETRQKQLAATPRPRRGIAL